MIDIEMKMFFTKELNEITVCYAKEVVLKKLFNKTIYDVFDLSHFEENNNIEVSDLIAELKYYNDGFSALPSHLAIEVIDLIDEFFKHIDKKDLTALYFLVFNEEQERYMDDFNANEYDENSENDFLVQFGRYMAKVIYEPKKTFIDADLNIYLQNQVLKFAEDFEIEEL